MISEYSQRSALEPDMIRRDLARSMRDNLSKREAHALVLLYGHGLGYREVGEAIGGVHKDSPVSRERARQISLTAMRKIRLAMGEYFDDFTTGAEVQRDREGRERRAAEREREWQVSKARRASVIDRLQADGWGPRAHAAEHARQLGVCNCGMCAGLDEAAGIEAALDAELARHRSARQRVRE